ncbi:MAG: hypothetical protein V1809_12545 [Planctomycetota bacterium]
MMNARTWLAICRMASILILPVVIGMFFDEVLWLRVVSVVAIALMVILGVWGAVLGIVFAFGKLYFGCPDCGAKSRVLGGGKWGMLLDCPQCGQLVVSWSFLGKLKIDGTNRFERKVGAFELDICGQKTIKNPSETDIRTAVFSLDAKKGEAFLILGATDMNYVQASGDRDVGFDMEYQEDDLQHHYRSKHCFSAEEIVRVFTLYKSGNPDWKRRGDWERMPASTDASSKFPLSRQQAWAGFGFCLLWGGLAIAASLHTFVKGRLNFRSGGFASPERGPGLYWGFVVGAALVGFIALVIGICLLARYFRTRRD